MHIVIDLLAYGHWNEADKWLTEKYIQHNPAFGSGPRGRDDGVQQEPPRPIPADPKDWSTKIVAVTTQGKDIVCVASVSTRPDPRNPGQTYTTTHFDMWRFVNGKADEHWDEGTINAGRRTEAKASSNRTPAVLQHAYKARGDTCLHAIFHIDSRHYVCAALYRLSPRVVPPPWSLTSNSPTTALRTTSPGPRRRCRTKATASSRLRKSGISEAGWPTWRTRRPTAAARSRECGNSSTPASKTTKADLLAALKESFEMCDAAYDGVTAAT